MRNTRSLEIGFGPNDVAVMGTSTERFYKMLETGHLPNQIPTKDGKSISIIARSRLGDLIYHPVWPLVDRIQGFKPELAVELRRRAAAEIGIEQVARYLDPQSQLEDAIYNAVQHATSDYFFNRTGHPDISVWGTSNLAHMVIPEEFESFRNEEDSESYFDTYDDDPIFLERVLKTVSRPELASILSKTLRRRGTLLVLNSGILEHQILPGELENSTMIVSKQPIETDVVSNAVVMDKE